MVIGVVILVALLAAEVILQLAGKPDTTISTVVTYAIPLIIGFLIGVPVNPGTTTSPN
jgi:hypothetical protein